MATKKKKTKKSNTTPKHQTLTPERYIREQARLFPITECYITHDWHDTGMSSALVARQKTDGRFIIGCYLLDTFCLGVKNASFYIDYSREQLDALRTSLFDMEEISYNELHNIIYGTIAFAETAGVHPAKEFAVTQYILEDDTEDIPLIEYDFGHNGKHFLVVGINPNDRRYIDLLKKRLGDDFDYIIQLKDDDTVFDESDETSDYDSQPFTQENLLAALDSLKKDFDEMKRHPEEEYTYCHPEYPTHPEVKNHFLISLLSAEENYISLADSDIKRILAIPSDELATDLSQLILYSIGATYKSIDNDTEDSKDGTILHALLLLTQTRSHNGREAILELMRQNEAFATYHLGDLMSDIVHPALYACAQDNVAAIETYLNQPGLCTYLRMNAVDALVMIIFNHPERRAEIMEIFRRLLTAMVTRLPRQEACDGAFAGLMMCSLMDIKATELIPEIKAVFATNCVDTTIAGNCSAILRNLEKKSSKIDKYRYTFPDIHTQYKDIRSMCHN